MAGTSSRSVMGESAMSVTLEDMQMDLLMSSLVPDLVIKALGGAPTTASGVLMLGDVSGFTELCDKYSMNSIKASTQITQIINEYLGEMVRAVYLFGGDVAQFAGDSFLAFWSEEEVSNATLKAMDCAVYIQHKIGPYETQVNTLRVKLALTRGVISLLMVGDQVKRDFVIIGQAIMMVKDLEHKCLSGDILVSKSLRTAKVKARYLYKDFNDYGDMKLLGLLGDIDLSTLSSKMVFYINETVGHISLRPAVKMVSRMQNEIKSFMMSVVRKSFETTGKIDQITQVRQVVIVFINLITQPYLFSTQLEDLIKDCYSVISWLSKSMQGSVNKLNIFDKDLMILVIFGLPYYRSSKTEQAALKFSELCRYELQKFDQLAKISIGVTSGTVYCGVVGHPIRKEFTVMGLTVNKAARLMVAYEDKIVCDRETFLHSQLDFTYFTLQEQKYLKGISHVGSIYMYNTIGGTPIHYDVSISPPLLNREKEMTVFSTLMSNAMNYQSRDILSIVGTSRSGKSKLLQEMMLVAQDKCSVQYFSLSKSTFTRKFAFIEDVCKAHLSISSYSTIYEIQGKILEILSGSGYNKDFICSINTVFKVDFRYTSKYELASADEKEQWLYRIMVIILAQVLHEPSVILVDDAEFMDPESWKFMEYLLQNRHVLIVTAVGDKFPLCKEGETFLLRENFVGLTLGPIDPFYIASLACQMLSVEAISSNLAKELISETKGEPGNIESLLISRIQMGRIEIEFLDIDNVSMSDLEIAPDSHIKRIEQPLKKDLSTEEENFPNLFVEVDDRTTDAREGKIKVCILKTADYFTDAHISSKAVFLRIYYQLPATTRDVLKVSAILGETFSRSLLVAVSPLIATAQFANVIKNLFDLKIFFCGSRISNLTENSLIERKKLVNPSIPLESKCYCKTIDVDLDSNMPKYAYCNLLQFFSMSIIDDLNVLIGVEERKKLNVLIVNYLQTIDRRCTPCKHSSNAKHNISRKKFIEPYFPHHVMSKPGEILLKHLEDVSQSGASLSRDEKSLNQSMTKMIKFAHTSFSDCQCQIINIMLNEQLLVHCTQGELFESATNIALDNALSCIALFNIPSAISFIEKAKEFLSISEEHIVRPYSWKISCTKGIIVMLEGMCCYKLGDKFQAYLNYKNALTKFAIKVPRTKYQLKLKYHQQLLKLKFSFNSFKPYYKAGKPTNQIMDSLSTECLYFLSQVSKQTLKWDEALLYGIWAFNRTLTNVNHFYILNYALANILSMAGHYANSGCNSELFCVLAEFALKIVNSRMSQYDKLELRSVLHLYQEVMIFWYVKGDLEEGTTIGQVAMVLTIPAQKFETKLRILPRVILMSLFKMEMEQALAWMQELESLMTEDVDHSSRTWHLALLLYVKLYCGIDLLSKADLQAIYSEKKSELVVRDALAERLLESCIWLKGVRDSSKDPLDTMPEINPDTELHRYVIPRLMLLEGLLVCLSREPSEPQASEIRTQIDLLKQHIYSIVLFKRLLEARYLHLRAYEECLEQHASKSNSLMNASRRMALQNGNLMEASWVAVNKKVWFFGEGGHQDISTRRINPLEWKGKIINQLQFFKLPLKIRQSMVL